MNSQKLYLIKYIDYRKEVTFDLLKTFIVNDFLDIEEVKNTLEKIKIYLSEKFTINIHNISFYTEKDREYVFPSDLTLVEYKIHNNPVAIILSFDDDDFVNNKIKNYKIGITTCSNYFKQFNYSDFYVKVTENNEISQYQLPFVDEYFINKYAALPPDFCKNCSKYYKKCICVVNG